MYATTRSPFLFPSLRRRFFVQTFSLCVVFFSFSFFFFFLLFFFSSRVVRVVRIYIYIYRERERERRLWCLFRYIRKSVIRKLRNLLSGKSENLYPEIPKSIIREFRNRLARKSEICYPGNPKSVIREIRNLLPGKSEIERALRLPRENDGIRRVESLKCERAREMLV